MIGVGVVALSDEAEHVLALDIVEWELGGPL